MLFSTGDVFWADIPKSNKLNGSRPVVILETIGDNKVKIIPISSNPKYLNKNRVAIKLLLSDKVSYVCLLPDRATIIPSSWLKTQVGTVNSGVMKMLISMVTNKNISNINENCIEPSSNSDLIIFQKAMDAMKPYIIDSNKILNDMISKKALIVNIIVAIVTGVIASLITNYIWLAIGFKS